ncbi:MAG: hypothetical protein RJA29_898 [Pseudomonadota bacterium]
MPITAQSIIRRCIETLQDNTSVRWPVNELVRYLNDGQREVVLHRPDAMVTSATVTCVPGTKQTLPANGAKLIEVVRNARAAGTKRAVRMVNREILDAQTPGWHAIAGTDDVLHFMYDPRDPRVFYVYPPATAATQLDIVYAAYPADIAEPADGALFTAVTGNISLPDIYGNALQDYILYRAYSKDSEYAGNAQRAQAHYAAFANALGIEIKATIAVAPNPVGNPNRNPLQIPG